MSKLIPVMLFALLISYLIEQRDKNLLKKYDKCIKEKILTLFLIMLLGIFAGLRNFYNDTKTYIEMYHYLTPDLKGFISRGGVSFADAIGFSFINSLLKTLEFSSQDYIMIYSIANMVLYITFIRRHSENLTFSMFLFFTVGCYVFSLAAIKQSMAMAFGCWAYHYACEEKWKKYIVFVILSSLFHPYALIYLLIPLMMFKPWTSTAIIWIFAFIVVGISLPTMFGTIIDITTMMGANYTVEEFAGEGVNVFRLLVCLAPTILSFIFSNKLYEKTDKKDYLLMNLTMLNGLIMFVGLFGTANYFARLANFFLPFQILSIPWLVKRLDYDNRVVVLLACVAGYLAYMYYENAIVRQFDLGFNQVTLCNYLKGLFS